MIDTCGADHCITCSDEAVPLRVVLVSSVSTALCANGIGETSEVMIDLVGPLEVGDTILVHAGTALALANDAEQLWP